MNRPESLLSQLPVSQKQMTTGVVTKKEDEKFSYLLISKTNKGITTKEHIQEKLKKFPNALIVTIGDTQVDFPMHQNAHITFHVGLESVWLKNSLPNCIMIRDLLGQDRQHVEGTLKVLQLLEEAIGKILLRSRGLIESVNNKLKACCQIEHHRHRSPLNFLVNLVSGIVAYSYDAHKPTIRVTRRERRLFLDCIASRET